MFKHLEGAVACHVDSGTTLANGGVPCALRQCASRENDSRKAIGAAIVEVELAAALLQQHTLSTCDNALESSCTCGDVDSGRVGQCDGTVGGGIGVVDGQSGLTNLNGRASTKTTGLPLHLQVLHRGDATVEDGLACIVARQCVEHQITCTVLHEVTLTTETAIGAIKRISTTSIVDIHALCDHHVGQCHRAPCGFFGENHLIACHKRGRLILQNKIIGLIVPLAIHFTRPRNAQSGIACASNDQHNLLLTHVNGIFQTHQTAHLNVVGIGCKRACAFG